MCGVAQCGTHLIGGQGVLGRDRLDRLTRGNCADDRRDVDARTPEARLAEPDVGNHIRLIGAVR